MLHPGSQSLIQSSPVSHECVCVHSMLFLVRFQQTFPKTNGRRVEQQGTRPLGGSNRTTWAAKLWISMNSTDSTFSGWLRFKNKWVLTQPWERGSVILLQWGGLLWLLPTNLGQWIVYNIWTNGLIFHQAGFSWNKGDYPYYSLSFGFFWSCEVAIIRPEWPCEGHF